MSNVTPEIEKVAEKLYPIVFPHEHPRVSWGQICRLASNPSKIVAVDMRERCIELARAALLAIREPTERMIEGASKATALQECPGCQWPNDWADGEVETFRYRSVFAIRAAIDAALGEDKG